MDPLPANALVEAAITIYDIRVKAVANCGCVIKAALAPILKMFWRLL